MTIKMNIPVNIENENINESVNDEDFFLTEQEAEGLGYARENMYEMIEGKPTKQKELMAEKCLMIGFLNGSDWLKNISDEFINKAIEKEYSNDVIPENTEKESYIRGVKDAMKAMGEFLSTIYDKADIEFDDEEDDE